MKICKAPHTELFPFEVARLTIHIRTIHQAHLTPYAGQSRQLNWRLWCRLIIFRRTCTLAI